MKLILLLIALITFQATAQTLPDFTAPKTYKKILEVKGDLDKDGIAETILAYDANQSTDQTGFKRVLYICKLVNGKLKLWKENKSILWNSKDCGFCIDNGIDLSIEIKNNTFIVKQTFWHNTRHTSIFKNVFRYQNADWFLIGSTYNDRYNCGYDHTYDINFSTKQVQINYDSEDCDDDTPQSKPSQKKFKYPFKSIPKMDGFIPGKIEIKIPNDKFFFYY